MSSPSPIRFCALVPVKPTDRAKSRLAPLGDRARRALVAAFAADTVRAALASPLVEKVLVVTDDVRLARDLGDLGAHVMPDGVADDLNASLVQAAAEADRRWPGLGIAAVCADVPALDTGDLTLALEACSRHAAAFVPDLDDGTTMLTALTPDDFRPRFGHGSRAAHAASGAHEVTEVVVPTLRRDVDTPEDLRDALDLGVGERTAEVAGWLRL